MKNKNYIDIFLSIMSIYVKYNDNSVKWFKKMSQLYKDNRFDDIIILNCNDMEIESFLKLPNKLEVLNCYGNKLKELVLPNTLKELWCGLNELESLDNLPDSLEVLHCEHNKITSLGVNSDFPSKLRVLQCINNKITKIGKLSSTIESFDCDLNPIKINQIIKYK